MSEQEQTDVEMDPAEKVAKRFHETYERLAPDHGYETRKDSAVPWEDVPAKNKGLMIAVCDEVSTELRKEHWREAFDLAILCVNFGGSKETETALRKYAELMIAELNGNPSPDALRGVSTDLLSIE